LQEKWKFPDGVSRENGPGLHQAGRILRILNATEELMIILHCADLHLGRRPQGGRGTWSANRYDDYFKAFSGIASFAVQRGVDCLTIAGDIFDSNSMLPATLARTESILEQLKENGIPVVVTWGNHDRPGYGGDSEFWLAYLVERGLVLMPRAERSTTTSGPVWNFSACRLGEVSFWTPGWWMSQNEAALAALAGYLATVPGPHVVLAHIAISGRDLIDQGAVAAEHILPFKELVVFMGGGHFHSFSHYPREAPFFFVPGSPEYFDIAERASEKAVVLFNTENGEWERVPVKPRPKHELSLDTDTADFETFLHTRLQPLLAEIRAEEGDMIRLEVRCAAGIWLDAGRCESWLEETGCFGKASVILRHSGVDGSGEDSAAGQERPVEEIIREFVMTREIFSDYPDETMRLLNGLATGLRETTRSGDAIMERIEEFCTATKGKT